MFGRRDGLMDPAGPSRPQKAHTAAAPVVAYLELRLCLASFRGMMDFVFKPSLRLARDVTVRTLDDAAEFARTYV